ncbi:MAG: hypothetical protein H6935_05280 [Thiobacillus sp.]|nr:hypothetical protein [Thiobacillus sp.]
MDQHNMHAYPQYPQQAAMLNTTNAMQQGAGMGQGAYHQGMQVQGGYAQGMGYPMYATHYPRQSSSLLGFANDRFLKGLLIGAAAAYLLTNENVQRTAIKGAVKAWSLLQGGVEEMKERFHDAEAEIRAESAE